ncbi:MAG: rane-associated phospholipid phosphatase [Bacteroidetes bacterium]|nr:rane-associated phospholipid phosphatase [Bacteroidota bacterium]
MKHFFKNNWYILTMYLLCLCFSAYFILSYGKIAVHIYLNQLVGNSVTDSFFYYLTYLGDGRIMPFLIIIILLYNVRLGIYTAVTFFCAIIITTILKNYFYDEVMRPFHVFQWTVHTPLNYVNKDDLYIHNSFPSGHATQAFAIFMCLVFYSKRAEVKLLFFALALFTAFSRVYLSQHWLVDITVGSLIGTLCSILFYYVFIEKNALLNFNKSFLKINKS